MKATFTFYWFLVKSEILLWLIIMQGKLNVPGTVRYTRTPVCINMFLASDSNYTGWFIIGVKNFDIVFGKSF
jgi:hypothetical protein